MEGQACAGTGEEGHLIIFTRARKANEEKKQEDVRMGKWTSSLGDKPEKLLSQAV